MNEEDKVHRAYINSYRVIFLGVDFDEIIDSKHPYFVHNPARRIPKKVNVKGILDYFVEIRDFKKCIVIKKYIKEKQISL